MEWMDELEKAVRRAPEQDEDEQDEFGGEDEQEEPMAKPVAKCGMQKSAKAEYDPADNGDDDTEDHEGTTAGTLEEVAPQRGAKKQNLYPKTRSGVKKSLAEGLDGEVADAIEVSDILSGLTKSIDGLNSGRDAEIAELRAEVVSLSKGLEVIGKALVKSLKDSNEIAKSLRAEVDAVGRQPAQRKSTVRKIEKSFGGDAGRELPSKAERLEKSMTALKSGLVSPVDCSKFESAANRGEFREDIWRKMGGE